MQLGAMSAKPEGLSDPRRLLREREVVARPEHFVNRTSRTISD